MPAAGEKLPLPCRSCAILIVAHATRSNNKSTRFIFVTPSLITLYALCIISCHKVNACEMGFPTVIILRDSENILVKKRRGCNMKRGQDKLSRESEVRGGGSFYAHYLRFGKCFQRFLSVRKKLLLLHR